MCWTVAAFEQNEVSTVTKNEAGPGDVRRHDVEGCILPCANLGNAKPQIVKRKETNVFSALYMGLHFIKCLKQGVGQNTSKVWPFPRLVSGFYEAFRPPEGDRVSQNQGTVFQKHSSVKIRNIPLRSPLLR